MTIDFVKNEAQKLKCSEKIEENLTPDWGASTLSHGYPGLLLTFTALDELYPDEGWDRISHHYVVKIKELVETGKVGNLTLFGGLAGCCFAIQSASRGGTRYRKLIEALNQMLFTKAENEYMLPIEEKVQLKLPCSPKFYDPISGITGLSVIALQNQDLSVSSSFLKKALSLCIALTNDLQIGPYQMPGWYVPKHLQFTESDKQSYPKGNFNLGLAHGIPSILALLSIAHLQGIRVEGQTEAIQKIADWLIAKKKEMKGSIYWENRICFEEEVLGQQKSPLDGSMDGWCYGTPGVARVLYLAGKALKNSSIQLLAHDAFLGIYKRNDLSFYSPTICHGLSGLLTINRLMQRDTGCLELAKWGEQLENKLLSYYQPTYPFGFKEVIIDYFNQTDQGSKTKEEDFVGVLSGTSGILLSLLSKKMKTLSWARIFLIEEITHG